MPAPLPLWIDCDVALGARYGDVDDGFALAAALAAPGARLLGISTVFGNTSVRSAAACAQRLLRLAGRDVPVIPGARRSGEAVPEVVDALRALPAGTRLLCLGPLTNVAAALAADPGLGTRVRMYMVGGDLDSRGRFPPLWPFEFNLAKDPAAARAVLAVEGERLLFPLPVCRRLEAGPLRLLGISRLSPIGSYLARHSLRWLLYAPLRYRSLRFPLWDAVPLLNAVGALEVEFAVRRIALRGRGGLVESPHAPPTRCATGFDAHAAWAALRINLSMPGVARQTVH